MNHSFDHLGPLHRLPSELIDVRSGQVKLLQTETSEARPFLFELLKRDCKLDRRTIWQHIFPYRQIKLMCPSSCNSCQVVYDYFISSLESWFHYNRLTPLNFSWWSVSILLTIMRDLSKDLEARRIYFKLISEDMADLFRAASQFDLNHLADLLIANTTDRRNLE